MSAGLRIISDTAAIIGNPAAVMTTNDPSAGEDASASVGGGMSYQVYQSEGKVSNDEPKNLRKISKESAGSSNEFYSRFGRRPSEILEELEQQDGAKKSESFALAGKIGSRGGYSKLAFSTAETMPAVVLMNNGRFDDLTESDLEDLFVLMDKDCNGVLDFGEIRILLKEVLKPPCTDEQVDAVYALTDMNADGHVTPEELLRALKAGPLKDHMKGLQKDNQARKMLEEMLGLSAEVDRDLLVERLKWIVGRDDAFRTLPFSLLYLSFFIFLVVAHLRIWERQQVEQGLQSWVTGYAGGPVYGPYLDAVADVNGMWGWMEVSGLQAVFGKCSNNTEGLPRCQVGTRNLLLSDAELKMVSSDGSELSSWLLSSEANRTRQHLESNPMDYLGAALVSLRHLRSEWRNQRGVVEILLKFNTYVVKAQLFATTKVSIGFNEFGQAVPAVTSTAVVINPYPSDTGWKVLYIFADAVYMLFLLVPLYSELKDMIYGMRLTGIYDGFVSYWGIWNGVDWVSIVTGATNVTMWVLCCQAMSDSSIHDLLTEADLELLLTPRAMLLDVFTLESLQLAFDRIINLFFALHMIMGLTGVAIMMKFFKAFQANPRLQLVTNTLVKASTDIFHFSVVFLLVFLGFAVTGHILLGSDVAEFRSFGTSIDTAFVCLMGDFGWYAESSKSDQPLGSGLPKSVMVLWFWLYMVFVVLIMINMLLAIVLGHYTELNAEVMNSSDAPALWTQCMQYFAQSKSTKKFIPNTSLVRWLEDDDTPCHTTQSVTQESLLSAFPDMKMEQAQWLMKWLRGEAIDRMRAKDDQVVARLKILESFVESIASDLHVVNLNVAVCTSKLDSGLTQGTEFGGDGSSTFISTSLADQLAEQVDRLTLTVGGAVRDLAAQLQGATEALARQKTTLSLAARPPAIGSQPANAQAPRELVKIKASQPLATVPLLQAGVRNNQVPREVPNCFSPDQ